MENSCWESVAQQEEEDADENHQIKDCLLKVLMVDPMGCWWFMCLHCIVLEGMAIGGLGSLNHK